MGQILTNDMWNYLHIPSLSDKKLILVNGREEIDITKHMGRNSTSFSSIDGSINLDSYIPCLKDSKIYFYKDEDSAFHAGFYEDKRHGYFVPTQVKLGKDEKPVFEAFQYSNNSVFSDLDLGKKSPTFLLTNGMKYTFGVEIETVSGKLPYWVYNHNKLSLKCERDGSLKDPKTGKEEGGEYITGVLTGDYGLKNLKTSLREISQRCTIDKRCGIHVHVGNCDFNERFIILAYILSLKIQDEVFQTLPISRRKNNTCGLLPSEDYVNIIKNYNIGHGVEICYNDLFTKLANGRQLDAKINKYNQHPGGRYTDRYSKSIPPEKLYRYKWVNYIPTAFNMKGTKENPVYTIEFRCHPGSMNFVKIKNWIMFCFAFCSYVENHYMDIVEKDNITIEDILKKVYGRKAKPLIEYIEERKSTFSDPIKGNKTEVSEYRQKTVNKPVSIKRLVKNED